MELVSIAEFQHLTKLTDHDTLAMLENGELAVAVGPLGELLIDVENLSPDAVAKRSFERKSVLRKSDVALMEEMIASEIVSSLDEIIDEALELAMSWRAQRHEAEYAEEEG